MSALPQGVSGTGRCLHREFNAARPVFIFSLVAFLLQLSIIKLAVAQFSIPVSALRPREPVQGRSFDAQAASHSQVLAKMSEDIAAAILAEAEQKS